MGIILIILTLCGQPQSYIINEGTNWAIFNQAALPLFADKYKDVPLEQQVILPLDYGNKDRCL